MDCSAIEITQMNGQIATLESIRAELSEPEAKTLAKLKKAAKNLIKVKKHEADTLRHNLVTRIFAQSKGGPIYP